MRFLTAFLSIACVALAADAAKPITNVPAFILPDTKEGEAKLPADMTWELVATEAGAEVRLDLRSEVKLVHYFVVWNEQAFGGSFGGSGKVLIKLPPKESGKPAIAGEKKTTRVAIHRLKASKGFINRPPGLRLLPEGKSMRTEFFRQKIGGSAAPPPQKTQPAEKKIEFKLPPK